MIVSVPRETAPGERRVALTPDVVKRLAGDAVEIRVESGAGSHAGFVDEAYTAAGATIVGDAGALWGEADVLLTVQRPALGDGADQVSLLHEGAVVVGMLQPLTSPALVKALAGRKVTAMSLDQLPRISRAQSMDTLSSQATVAGYKAVLLAATHVGKMFPMLITAAGTIAPAKVLILGAGVAGLQAIATARRLGAVVEAFDVRPAVKEQVESLGAKFVSPAAVEAEGEGGYAKQQTEDQQQNTLDFLHGRVPGMDIVITTALIPGKPAPLLITEAMVKDMRPGAVIVDLAAEMGGNCELTRADETVVRHGVTVLGPLNIPASVPFHASQMFAKNLQNFLAEFVKDGSVVLDFENEVISGTCITHEGRVVHERTRQAMGEGDAA